MLMSGIQMPWKTHNLRGDKHWLEDVDCLSFLTTTRWENWKDTRTTWFCRTNIRSWKWVYVIPNPSWRDVPHDKSHLCAKIQGFMFQRDSAENNKTGKGWWHQTLPTYLHCFWQNSHQYLTEVQHRPQSLSLPFKETKHGQSGFLFCEWTQKYK